ncbi:MAG TPA: DUF4440 domain-containing protein [Candidatus Polarisedimenticolia bacterium]|nr:DUF4440 domain-containing protein [Candidatus Polarisedimenticolia bacterium]
MTRRHAGPGMLILSLALIAPTACAKPEPIEVLIREANGRLVEAFNRGDAAGVAALYDEEAAVLPPDQPTVNGRQAIEGFFAGLVTAGGRGLALEIADVQQSGDRAIERGGFRMTVQPPGGQPIPQEGKYVVIWKRQPDGAWKVSVDIFNNNAPAAPTPSAPSPAPAG